MFRWKVLVCVTVPFLCCGVQEAMAGSFRNLGFEDAIVLQPPTSFLPASEALPYWTANFGNIAVTQIPYDSMAIGSSCISLHDGLGQYGLPPLRGQYSVFLQSTWNPEHQYFADTVDPSLSQIGDVLSGTRSVRLLADAESTTCVNGQILVLTGGGIASHVWSSGRLCE